jgi:hypothetical protein
MKHQTIRAVLAASALAVAALAGAPASAQAQKPGAPNLKAIPEKEMKAMEACVSGVLGRLQQERASYRAVKPAVGQECDAQLRAVLAAAIKVGQAGPCTTVEGCIEMARGRAGDDATMEFQRATIRR